MIIAVDIGGTKVKVASVEVSGKKFSVSNTKLFQSKRYDGLQKILLEYARDKSPTAVSIGVAGPVIDGAAEVTNLPWIVDSAEISQALGGVKTYLINDLQAHGYGIPLLDNNGIAPLRNGKAKAGNRVLAAAGTGFGQSILFWDGENHIPSATEGGHTGFAPRNDEDIELLRFAREKFGNHVSWERLVSGGDGFPTLYEFIKGSGQISIDPDLEKKIAGGADVGEVITESADSGVEIAKKVLSLFVELYGCEVGNLALKGMAIGGVYLGGGIANKILPWMKDGSFLREFAAKGRFKPLLDEMPVYVITDEDNAIKGAANYAVITG